MLVNSINICAIVQEERSHYRIIGVMQRSVPSIILRVDIRSAFQQQSGNVVLIAMRVSAWYHRACATWCLRYNMQSGLPGIILGLKVCAPIQQRCNNGDVGIPHRIM